VFLARTSSNQRSFRAIPEPNRAKNGAKQILNQDCVSVSTCARWNMPCRFNPMRIRTCTKSANMKALGSAETNRIAYPLQGHDNLRNFMSYLCILQFCACSNTCSFECQAVCCSVVLAAPICDLEEYEQSKHDKQYAYICLVWKESLVDRQYASINLPNKSFIL
jgi:hypothetical protein